MAQGDTTSAITTNDFKVGGIYDGVDDDTLLGNNALNTTFNGLGAVTLCQWIKATSLTGADPFSFSKVIHSGSVGAGINLTDDTGQFTIRVGGRALQGDAFQSHTSTAKYNYDTWVHIVGVINYATDTISLYINGTLEGSSSVTFGATAFVVGSPSFADAYGSGNGTTVFGKWVMKDVRVYTKALTAAEAAKVYAGKPFTDSLAHHWPCTEDFKDDVGGVDPTVVGAYIGTFDGQIATAVRDLRVTAADKWLALGTAGGQIVNINIEEA